MVTFEHDINLMENLPVLIVKTLKSICDLIMTVGTDIVDR